MNISHPKKFASNMKIEDIGKKKKTINNLCTVSLLNFETALSVEEEKIAAFLFVFPNKLTNPCNIVPDNGLGYHFHISMSCVLFVTTWYASYL